MDDVIALLDRMDQSRERMLVAIELLPDEALLEPETIGRFSVADVLALQTAWEAELVTALMRLDQGKKPEKFLAALADPEGYDLRRFEEYRGRDLDRIFDDLQQVRMQLETWMELFSERDLMDRRRFKWLEGRSLLGVISGITYEREGEYATRVADFARRWQDVSGSRQAEGYVSMSDITLNVPISAEGSESDENQT